ncbi:D-2-hydroxyacid dehydrogenase [Peribacillus sp. SCS-155]|uniref:D-2-hydroxyacid dehydrogenase n=1 Tax=Peribacillus sedimenti TaxID=3115297 RepID=UPI0039067302
MCALNILATFLADTSQQKYLQNKFPEVSILFHDGLHIDDPALKDAEVLVTYGEDLTALHIQRAKNLRWIMVISAGLELMPLSSIAERNILVTNARGIHKIPMAEYTIGMILQHEKQLKEFLNKQQQRIWNRDIQLGELHGKTMLVMGTGAIGEEIARLAKAFRLHTVGVNRTGGRVENFDEIYAFDEIAECLHKADYVISVLPSTPETEGMLKEEHFNRMKNGAVFINIGRGNLFKDTDLLKALENKVIARAVLDVFNVEPLPENHPYWTHESITVTPHISSRTKGYMPRAMEIFEQNLFEYLSGGKNFINVIDLHRGY